MLKGILIAVFVVILCVGGYMYYKQNYAPGGIGSGDVTVRNAPADAHSTDATNTDLDGNAAVPTPSRSDAPGTVNGDAVGTQQSAGMTPAPAAAPPANTTALPVADTIAPNPPNGAVFAGTGKFTWYRQGNLTWRVNSSSGSACIAFATMDEWQKPLVYTHGCGNA